MATNTADKPVYYTYEDYPPEDLYLYAGIDCIVTSELASKLLPKCLKKPLYATIIPYEKAKGGIGKRVDTLMSIMDSYEEFTATAHEFILDLELNGIKYDIEGNIRTKERMEDEIAGLEAEIFTGIGKLLNLDSGVILGEFLYGELGLEVAATTKTGEPSTDGDALKALAKLHPEHPWLVTLAKRNDIASLYRMFIANYVRDFVKRDGRIHPSYNMHGTGSFRLSGEDPNLTQLPRPKHGYNIRELYGVDEGNVFLAFDFSSAEVKILGALCKDPALLQAIKEGKDFHSLSASKMYGIDYDIFIAVLESENHPLKKDYKEKRQYSKALTFGILYGSSPNGIALNLGISLDQAKELIDLYFKNFPGIKIYVDCSHKMALENHYVVNPFGQRKMTYGAMEIFKGTAVYNGALRLAQNVRVQGTSSSFGLWAFTQFNTAIKPIGGKSLCTVYDSIEIEVPLNRAAEALELGFIHLNDAPVQQFDWLDLPVGVDAEIGTTWGNAKHIARGSTQEQIVELIRSL